MRARTLLPVLVVLAIAGCGPQGDLVKSRPAIADVDPTPQVGATPAQAALSWWNALRARDPEAAVARLTPAARRTIDLPLLRRTMREGFGDYAEQTEAIVLYTEHERHRVTVYMRLDGGSLVGSRLIKRGSWMLAVPFVSRGGTWLIENAAWMRQMAESIAGIKAFNERLRREALKQRKESGEGGN